MFDLAKIALALDAAEKIGTNSTVRRLSADARDEFVKLRKAIEDAPRGCVNVNADEETGMFWAHVTTAVKDETMNHTPVLLVRLDD